MQREAKAPGQTKAQAGEEDKDELQVVDEEQQRTLAERAREHFDDVCDSVERIFDQSPTLEIDKDLSIAEKEAIESIFAAMTGKDRDGTEISAAPRRKLLEQGIAALMPALSIGQRADFPSGQRRLADIMEHIARLREALQQQGMKEAIGADRKFYKVKDKRDADDEENEDDAQKAAKKDSGKVDRNKVS